MSKKPWGFWKQSAEKLAVAFKPEDANAEDGGIRVWRDGKLVHLHRWIWEQLVGPIPDGYVIDHKNGIRSDNRLKNLQCVPHSVNMRNMKQRTDNTSGVKGVDFWVTGNSWRAKVKDHKTGKWKAKTFSLNKYGDDAFQMAVDWRLDRIDEMNAEGAGYSRRHSETT